MKDDEFEGRPELIKKRAKAYRVEWFWRALWFLGIVIVMAMVVYDTIIGQRTRAHLTDCVVAGGECYQESQQRTAEAVRGIILGGRQDEIATRRIVALAAFCADKPGTQTEREIASCIKRQLDRDEVKE